MDAAVKDRLAFLAGEAPVHLVGGAVRHPVLDTQLVVDVGAVAGHENAVHVQFGAALVDKGAHVVAAQPVAGHQLVAVDAADAALTQQQGADVQTVAGLALQPVMAEMGVVAGFDGGHRVGEHRAPAQVLLDQRHAAAGAEHHFQPRVAVRRLVAVGVVNHLHGAGHVGVGGHFQGEGVVQRGAVVERERRGQALQPGRFPLQGDAVGQGAGAFIQPAVDQHQAVVAQLGQIRRGGGGRGAPVQVAVGQRLQRGVFPLLGLAAGEHRRLQRRQAAVAQRRQRRVFRVALRGVLDIRQRLAFEVLRGKQCTHALWSLPSLRSPVSQP